MKAITTTMYVCGGLMVAAAIMGAVDYSSASRKGTLEKLYKEEKPEVKAPEASKEIDIEDYSRGEINPPDKTMETVAAKKTIAKKTVVKTSKPVVRKNKKLSLKKFSRAAIIDEIPLPDSISKK